MLELIKASDLGKVRKLNEDSIFAEEPVLLVADGLGGHNAGEIASGIAVQVFRSWAEGLANKKPKNVTDTMKALAEKANEEIYARATGEEDFSGMGTTLTAAAVIGDSLHLVHVGDSRAYLFREGKMRRLTRDHTYVADMVERGRMTAEEAKGHPQRSVLTKALGTEPHIEVDAEQLSLRDGDVLLLCTDGLTSLVDESEIARVVRELPLEDAVPRLIQAAKDLGGYDNISIVAARVTGIGPKLVPAVLRRSSHLWQVAVGFLFILLFAGAAVLSPFFLGPVTLRLSGDVAVIYRGYDYMPLMGAYRRVLAERRDIAALAMAVDERQRLVAGVKYDSLAEAEKAMDALPGGNE